MDFPSSVINLQIILSLNGLIDVVKIEVQGMIAKNEERRSADMADAYNEQHFYDKAEEIRSLSEQLSRI